MLNFFINGDGFNSGGFSLPLAKIMDLDERSLLNQFSDIVQSNEDIEIDDGSFTIEVYHVTLPRGAGFREQYLLKSYGKNLENILKSTKSLVNIPRRVSPYCASAALLVGKEISIGELNSNSWRSRKFTNRMVNRLIFQSKSICRQAGLSVSECGVNLEGVKKLAQLSQFCDHPIHVISRECHNSVVLSCNKDGIERPIYLYLADNHFFPVRSVNSLLGGDGRFCPVCDRFVTGRTNRHICDAKVCCQCKTVCKSPKFSSGFIQCDACLRYFHSETCFQNHLIVGKSSMFSAKFCVCDKIKACKECGVDLLMKNGKVQREAYSKRKHECFKSRCFCCGKYVDLQTHLCYLRKLDPLEPKFKQRIDKKRGQYCFFDMETMKVYDEELKRTVFKPNLIVFQFEDGTEEIFAGDQCLKQFSEFLFVGPHSLVAQDEYFTIIGHNAARFDSFFWIQSFLENVVDDPKIFFDGRSPIKITLGRKVNINDSFKFLQAPLSKLPGMFNLPVKKGFFPHGFNLPENQDYCGRIPPASFFETKFMTEKKYEEFEEWYLDWGEKYLADEISDWNFQEELLDYCSDDVTVLRLAWLSFSKAMYETTNLYVGIENITAASSTNMVWRTMIPEYTISLTPKSNYTLQNQQSKIALVWLKYNDLFYFGGELEYAGKNFGERVIYIGKKMYRVDGFHSESNTVLEFLGCVYHGCSNCFKNDLFSIHGGKTMRSLRTEVFNRKAQLEREGYNVILIWECEWKEMMNSDPEILSHLSEVEEELKLCKEPIDPRQALFGGRTEAISVYARADITGGETIKAVDFTSLYPSVMKEKDFPIFHPVVLRGSPEKFNYAKDEYFGLMHCKIIPPRSLFHPVLPTRIQTESGMKLVFSLCRSCSEI